MISIATQHHFTSFFSQIDVVSLFLNSEMAFALQQTLQNMVLIELQNTSSFSQTYSIQDAVACGRSTGVRRSAV